jgi:hypothetical protein
MVLGRYLGRHIGPQEQMPAVKADILQSQEEGGACVQMAFMQSRQQNGVQQGGSLTFLLPGKAN